MIIFLVLASIQNNLSVVMNYINMEIMGTKNNQDHLVNIGESNSMYEEKIYLQPVMHSKPSALDHEKCPSMITSYFDDFSLPFMYSDQNMTVSNNKLTLNEQFPLNKIEQTVISPKSHVFKEHNLTTNYKSTYQSKKSRPRQKGLRKLSQRAYDIVLMLKAATYKQVANKLVEELKDEKQLHDGSKQQQNIKRRVYDALNVLIALGLLRKDGRKIKQNLQFQVQRSSSNVLEKQYEKLKIKYEQMFFKNQKNKDKLKQSRNRKRTLQMIISRNYNMKMESQSNIHLPFFCAMYSQQQLLQAQITKERTKLCFGQKIEIFADADCIYQLHQHSSQNH